MAEWTIEDVAARFEEAASTGRRLPPVRVHVRVRVRAEEFVQAVQFSEVQL